MFTVAVVEDDETAVAKLRACLDQYVATHAGVQFDVTVFNEPTSFLDPYKTVWDIVFMDIEMPNMDGMEAAHRLRAVDSEVILIFVTNMAQFAAKGYEVDALDYIVKPFAYPDFECLCSISCCGFSHDDFSGLGRACRPRNGLNWMVLVSPPERTGKDYDQHAPSTVYPSFAAERGIRRVDRAENTCQRADGA